LGRVKGLVLLNARTFCTERFGDQGWSRVRDSLSPSDLEIVDGAVHVGWYDLGIYDRLHETVDRVLGDDDLRLMVDLGHYCAEHDLSTVHRLFMRMASPSFLLSKYGEFWRRYQDSGTWAVDREAPKRVRCTLSNWGSRSEATCVRLSSYIERFLQLAGGKGARALRTKCNARGDRSCEYLCEWDSGLSGPS